MEFELEFYQCTIYHLEYKKSAYLILESNDKILNILYWNLAEPPLNTEKINSSSTKKMIPVENCDIIPRFFASVT